jgi:asparagine synthase (glutamine-hydrolysing)
MCGICGYIGIPVDISILQKMIQSLSHRGPDDSGYWTAKDAALGHTRLAIIDLSQMAHQPMITQDGRYVLVFNGEIYNYRELRQRLEQDGEVFKSNSDTEVILLGYRKWGKNILKKLRGMFAFAIWDDHLRQLFLARDRIGIKPLYYAPITEGMAFASEIKAILSHPCFSPEMNPAAVDLYLTLGYIPGPDTIFRGIQTLMPGCWLEWRERSFQTFQYWAPDFTRPPFKGSEKDLLEELDKKLNDAVKTHLVADVPVGAFLSGGIDSSLVAAIAQRHSREQLRTYTIGFSDGRDERHFARIVADHIHSNHHEHLITPDIVNHLPRLLWHLEQPLFDNSVLPTFLVSQFAREEVKVVLSGDGGDEPFAGYDWTRFAIALPNLPGLWSPSGWKWAYQRGFLGLLKKLLHDLSQGEDARYTRRMSVSRALTNWLYNPGFLQLQESHPSLEYLDRILKNAPVRDPRDRFLYADFCVYLPEDILFKVDRMSMANSLEVRVPLLDHYLLEWVFQLSFSMRFLHGRGKYLLRKLAARYLPSGILIPRKQGFTVPVGSWLHGELGDLVSRFFSSKSFKQRGIVHPQAALTLLAMHRSKRYDLGHRIWSLVILEVWARIWLDKQDAKQSLVALLKESED